MTHMKLLIIALFLFFTVQAFAQGTIGKFDIRLGVGRTLLGSGDIITSSVENEINYKLNPYFSSAIGFNFGRGTNGSPRTAASYLVGNLTLFVSTFRNRGRNDFRIVTSLTYYTVADSYKLYSTSFEYVDRQGRLVIDERTVFEIRQSLGFNAVIENTYSFGKRFLLGLKLFTQPYFNGDINSGVLLKIGTRI